MNATPGLATLRQQGLHWWRARTSRERQAMALVGAVLAAILVWGTLVQPALRTLREAPLQLDRLDAQTQATQRMAAEGAALRGAPRVSPTQASLALKAASDRLGDRARLVMQGERATLTLTGVNPEALRAWLAEARSGARARPVEAQLQRSAAGYTGTIGVTLGGGP